MVAEHVVAGVTQATVYTSPSDKAILVSEWLYGSLARIGHLESDKIESRLTDEQMEFIRENSSIQFIEFTGKSDVFGHSYFASSGAASSDLITLINTGARAGSPKRPLTRKSAIYWVMEDGYPFIGPTED